MRALVPFLTALLLASAHASTSASTLTFEGKCGDSLFRVYVENRGSLLENIYTVFGTTAQGEKRVFVGDVGGWFHAACVRDAKGKPLVLFQSYCGGSGCIEAKYGVIEPGTLKLLLTPSAKNISNERAASRVLGKPAPSLLEYKGTFCCER